MGFGKKLKKALKKTANVAVGAATGFATGGGIGGLAAGARQAVRESKGKPTALNFRSVGQSAVTGGAANLAAGLAFKGAGAVAAKGGLSGIYAKGAAFVKSGGITGNLGNIATGAKTAVAKFGPAISGFFSKGDNVLSSTEAYADSPDAPGQKTSGKGGFGLGRFKRPMTDAISDFAATNIDRFKDRMDMSGVPAPDYPNAPAPLPIVPLAIIAALIVMGPKLLKSVGK